MAASGTSGEAERILVIKLSALGDMVLAFPAFDRIRAAHPGARLTLLTTPPYAGLAAAGPWFDEVESDGRPASLGGVLGLIRRLRRARYDRVYDLQGNDRTHFLFQALRPSPPPWSGVARGCALPHRNPMRMRMHTLERQAEQLRDAGVWPDAPTSPGSAPGPDVGWLAKQAGPLRPSIAASDRPLALLVPGAAPKRPGKRWPGDRYASLARGLQGRGLNVALIGGPAEAELCAGIAAGAPGALNLAGATDFAALAALGGRAGLAVGNDTGPMHILAAAGAPSLVLFSADSDPALCAPRGRVCVMRRDDLKALSSKEVLAAAVAWMQPSRTM